MALSISARTVDPGLLALPWDLPLAQWPSSVIVSLPKGLSRHLVRFALLSGGVVAVKETTEQMARREYEMLGSLARLAVPCVERGAVIAGRVDAEGHPLPAALVTAHLKFSLPYRALFQQVLRPDTATRLVDALAVLLVRLHNVGFFWGDVSLSNTLFRRDAGAFAAYLVDAETGELHEGGLTAGQRSHDLDVARTNIAGEIMDLEAGGRLEGGVDAVAIADGIVSSYRSLWAALTDQETFAAGEAWHITERVQRLNDLGFDIDEMSMSTTADGTVVEIQPPLHRRVRGVFGQLARVLGHRYAIVDQSGLHAPVDAGRVAQAVHTPAGPPVASTTDRFRRRVVRNAKISEEHLRRIPGLGEMIRRARP